MQNEVFALDRATSEVRWRSNTSTGLPQTFGGTNVVLAGDRVVLGDSYVYTIQILFAGNRQLGAYEASTGRERWLISPPGGAQRFGGLPLAASDTLFVPTTSALLALRQQR
jgi:outer membrane protein assembly factor BamB